MTYSAPPPPLWLEGVPVHPFTVESLHAFMESIIESGRRARIFNVNIHAMNLAFRDPEFRRCLSEAEAVFCDGEGVRLGARIRGVRPPPERITYEEWIPKLAPWAAKRGYSFFFLGAEPGVAKRAAERLRQRFPGFEVAGLQDGFFAGRGISDAEVVERINASGAEILLLGMGMPLQEKWIGRNWNRLAAAIGLTGGACFDRFSGGLSPAPRWMARHGLEWLFRLGQEPVRLFRRYVIGNPWFLTRMVVARIRGGT